MITKKRRKETKSNSRLKFKRTTSVSTAKIHNGKRAETLSSDSTNLLECTQRVSQRVKSEKNISEIRCVLEKLKRLNRLKSNQIYTF